MDALPLQSVPVGYRFRPTDEELIDHYLGSKNNGLEKEVSVIGEIDVCTLEPWDLPHFSAIKSNDNQWFFFCAKDRKYQNGQRSKRSTVAGYWKATGRDRLIKSSTGKKVIGRKKSLVFHTGRAPKGARTHWVIHEYSATVEALDGTHTDQGAFVLCRLFKKPDGKQDENAESPNCDTVVKSSAEDTQSEPVTPTLGDQAKIQLSSVENFQPERMPVDSPLPFDWIADQLLDKTSIQDPVLEDELSNFFDSMPELPDSKIFSPSHLQMQLGLGSSDTHRPITGNFNNDPDGKQDENYESPNCDEVRHVCSPTVVKSSAEDTQSEPVTPMLDNQAEIQPPSGRITSDSPLLISVHSNSCVVDDANDQLLDITCIQPDPELEDALLNFCDPMPDLPDSIIFSSLHSQKLLEVESSDSHSTITDFSNDPDGMMQFQSGTDAFDVAEFLDSILSNEHSCQDSGIHMISSVESETRHYNNCLEWDFEDSDIHLNYPPQNLISAIDSEIPKDINYSVERVFKDRESCSESDIKVAQFWVPCYPNSAQAINRSVMQKIPPKAISSNILNIPPSQLYFYQTNHT